MIKRSHRLNGKDINFLFKRQRIIPGKYFSFFHFLQYPNKQYNQFSIQIPVKLTKKAVIRNLIKRHIFEFIRSNGFVFKKYNMSYYKIFIVFNKNTIPMINNLIESKNKKVITNTVKKIIQESFISLDKKLC